jgi:hypothetical protein
VGHNQIKGGDTVPMTYQVEKLQNLVAHIKPQKLASRKASWCQAAEIASRSEPSGNQAGNRHKTTDIARSQTFKLG